jgi:hypothetical protein
MSPLCTGKQYGRSVTTKGPPVNRVGNICNAYNHTWVILAGKKLSQHDKTSAVNNFIALNEGRIDFKTGGPVVFDLDTMEPVSDTGDASSGTPGTL